MILNSSLPPADLGRGTFRDTNFLKGKCSLQICVHTEPRHYWSFAPPPKPRGLQGFSQWSSRLLPGGGETTLRILRFRLQPVRAGERQAHQLSSWARVCPFHAAVLHSLRGSLQGKKGKLTLKTKYLQQQKLLGSPGLCDVIYVGEGGGLRRENQQCATSLSFVLSYQSQGNQYVAILYNRLYI